MAQKTSFLKKFIYALIGIIVISGVIGGFLTYRVLYQSNVNLDGKKSQLFYIRTGSSFDDVVGLLQEKNIIINRTSFVWLAKQMNYNANVLPGKYRINAGMGNRALIRLLKSGKQEAVTIPMDNLRTKDQLISRVGLRIEGDSIELKKLLNDNAYLKKYGLNATTIVSLFRPETITLNWNTSNEQFLDTMAYIYKKFWNASRKQKAKVLGLTQTEVITLASIVEQEQSRFNDEKAIIAGLYLNRIKKGMLLQADPTVVFAVGDFTINRVLNEHKAIDSPYNTYKYEGLPPGPICFPETSSIDAVLDHDRNDYIYMCAKDDFSGRHCFSKTYEQHQVYAKKYRCALDKKGIKN